jgi:hypothetical protein
MNRRSRGGHVVNGPEGRGLIRDTVHGESVILTFVHLNEDAGCVYLAATGRDSCLLGLLLTMFTVPPSD